MTDIVFHKMEGAGNDFVVLDNRTYGFDLDEIIRFTPKLCDRKFGIGADGILVLQPAEKEEVDYKMIYRNADGSDAGMCGNGARCLVMFAFHNGFGATQTFNVHKNVYEAEVHDDESVSVHFPVHVKPEDIQINEFDLVKADAATEHLIQFVEKADLDKEDELVQTGRSLRYHKDVEPPGSNVNFVHCEHGDSISLQTYERGVEDLTLACGTGALASAIAAHHHMNRMEKRAKYQVKVKGGSLFASFNFDPNTSTYHQLILTGPARFVFEGTISV